MQLIGKVHNYIQNKNPDFTDLDMDTDIIENRLVDSLQFLEFIMFIEEVAGSKIELETIDIEDYRSLNRIMGLLSRVNASSSKMVGA